MLKRAKKAPRFELREIVELRADDPRADPRRDPNTTKKITRAELDEALRRTKSGVREATRPRRRTHAPPESEKLEPWPAPLVEAAASSPMPTPQPARRPREQGADDATTATPLAQPARFPLGKVVLVGVLIASIVGFLAGRLLH